MTPPTLASVSLASLQRMLAWYADRQLPPPPALMDALRAAS